MNPLNPCWQNPVSLINKSLNLQNRIVIEKILVQLFINPFTPKKMKERIRNPIRLLSKMHRIKMLSHRPDKLCVTRFFDLAPNVEYMQSRRLRASNLSNRCDFKAGYNR